MPFVLDASIAVTWAFPDEDHPAATEAFARIGADEALAPALWWFEIRNVLLVNERRGRIDEAETAEFLRYLSRLRITIDRSADEVDVMALSRRHRLTVYDASYLELARREALPLATLEGELLRAARIEDVEIVGD